MIFDLSHVPVSRLSRSEMADVIRAATMVQAFAPAVVDEAREVAFAGVAHVVDLTQPGEEDDTRLLFTIVSTDAETMKAKVREATESNRPVEYRAQPNEVAFVGISLRALFHALMHASTGTTCKGMGSLSTDFPPEPPSEEADATSGASEVVMTPGLFGVSVNMGNLH